MLSAIAKPFGLLMMWLYEVTNQYGVAVILFALIVKLILLPFQMKSKRSTMRMSKLQGKMKEIEKKHGANKQKYNEEVQKLYQEEGINPMSGCLWSLIPFPILIALYQAIRYPITIMMGVSADLLSEGGALAEKLSSLGFAGTANSAYIQIEQSQFITNHWADFVSLNIEKLRQINYSFLGLDLGAKPSLSALSGDLKWAGVGLLLVPVIAALLSYFQSKVATPKKKDSEEPDPATQSTKGIMIVMPFITLWFAYLMPAALGVYWIASSAFAIIQDLILNKYFVKKLEIEDAERNAQKAQREAELEAKRKETERLKAENATTVNANTSKKKLAINAREEKREKAAEWQKRKDGESLDEPGRVDDRKYARGRAYDPNRYTTQASTGEEPEEVIVIEEAEDVDSVVDENEYETVEVEYEDEDSAPIDDEDEDNE